MRGPPDRENVVYPKAFRMAAARPGPPRSVLGQIEGYWFALRRRGEIPRRSELDPRGLHGALSAAFILERISPSVARFRVAGQVLTELSGVEMRGMPFTALAAHAARAELCAAMAQVCDMPAVARLDLVGEGGLLRPTLAARMVLLPLRDEDGEVARILGGLSVDGRPGRTPRRLEITGCQFEALETPPSPDPEPEAGHLRLVTPPPG